MISDKEGEKLLKNVFIADNLNEEKVYIVKELKDVLATTIDYCDLISLEELINNSRKEKKKIQGELLEDFARNLILGFKKLILEEKVNYEDIKPANILIHKDKDIKADFNGCKLISSSKKTTINVNKKKKLFFF